MTKIGNHLIILLLVLFGLSATSNAQDITVRASLSETNIFSGERVQLSVIISGQNLNSIDRPTIPDVPGLRWLSGNTGQSTNYTYVNGRPSISYTFTYLFIAENPGNYTFPSLSLQVNGKRYTTNTISFKIIDPSTIDNGQAERSPDIYLRLEPSTKTPVVGQQVIADIVLYFKSEVDVTSYQPSPGWKAEGFWKEELENRQQAHTTSTIINGVRYQRALLLQYAIFPTKAEKLTLSPFEVIVQVRQRNRRRDIFSFGLGTERLELQTLPVTLDVQPLPKLENATFSGAVGKFNISRSITPSEAFVGESVEITTTISGQGNIPLIVKPEYEFPEALEQYDPQESSTITRNNQQIAGTKTFTDIVIARNEGTFEIPAVNLAYFDPDKKQYSTVHLPALTLTAARDPRAVASSLNELRFDVQPITGLATWVPSTSVPLHKKVWVWILLLFPVLSLAGAYWYKSYSDRMNNDSAFARAQKAKELATKELEKAFTSDDVRTGYHFIEKALFQYITDKLNLPRAGLSAAQLVEALSKKTDSGTAKELKRLLDKCETIAYAPNSTPEGLQTDCKKAEELIKSINRQL